MPQSQYPAILAGQNGVASLLQALAPMVAWKTGVTSRSVTTQTTDPDLQLTVAANATYVVEASVIILAPSGGGFNYTWTVPSGVSGGYTVSFDLASTGFVTYGYGWTTSQLGATPSGTTVGMQADGLLTVGSTSGTFGLDWASNTSGDTVEVGAGSFLMMRRVA
jgi:hypothetical protein